MVQSLRMYVSMSRLRVPAERAAALVSAFRALTGAEAPAGRLRDAAAHVRGAETFLQ